MKIVNGVLQDVVIDGVKFETRIVPKGRKRRPGIKNSQEYITIHNTGVPNVKADNFARSQLDASQDKEVSWHITIDEKTVIQSLPLTEVGWHAGTSKGNYSSIGIEICERDGAEEVATKFVAQLLECLGKNVSAVRTHNSWSGKRCPRLILPHWDQFLLNVQRAADVDMELSNAVDKIVELGIIKTPDVWKEESKMDMKWVPNLLHNAGGVDKLVKDGVIVQPDIWNDGSYKPSHVAHLIKKIARVYGKYKSFKAKVTATRLNVRIGPDTYYANLESEPVLNAGTIVNVVDEEVNAKGVKWYKVELGRDKGYISAEYVERC